MTDDCELCGTPILDGQDMYTPSTHQVCQDECDRREQRGDCIWCGKNPQAGNKGYGHNYSCDECLHGPDVFTGYAGP